MINYRQKTLLGLLRAFGGHKKAVEGFPGVLDQVWNSGIEESKFAVVADEAQLGLTTPNGKYSVSGILSEFCDDP